jgi:PAS domain S-box-containing protein
MVRAWIERLRSKATPAAGAAVIAALLMGAAALLGLLHSQQLAVLALLIARGALLMALLRKGLRSRQASLPWSHGFMAVGAGLMLASDLLRAVPWFLSGGWPLPPSPAELLRFAALWAFLAGMAPPLLRRDEPFVTYSRILGTAVLLVGGTSLFWQIFIVPLGQLDFFHPGTLLWLIQDPLFAIMLALLAIRHSLMVARTPDAFLRSTLWAGFFALSGAAGIHWAYRMALGRSSPGLYVILIRVVASLMALGGTGRWKPTAGPFWKWVQRGRDLWDVLLPLLAAFLITGTTIVQWLAAGTFNGVGVAASMLVAALLLAREGIGLGQREMRKYQALVEGTGDLAFLMDQAGRITYANPAFRNARGLQDEGPVNIHLVDLLGSEEASRQLLARARGNGWSGEITLRMPHGGELPVHLSVRPIRLSPRGGLALSCVAHDLSERQQRENRLQRALTQLAITQQKLEELNQALEARVAERTKRLQEMVDELARLNEELKSLDRLKSDFLALVSHELRTPLTNISTGIELLLRKDTAREDAERRTLELIQAETLRLARLVETVLDLSALQAGRLELHPEPISFEEVWQTVVDRLGQREGLERLQVRPAQSVPPMYADPRALCSVLFHLLDNAFKYAPQGPIRVQVRPEQGGVEVSVEDAGPGIPKSERERIFEMFHRLDTRDAREVYGYGLGLPMARRLMEAMGGTIRVSRSSLGGARFTLWLPRFSQSGRAASQRLGEEAKEGEKA